MGTISLPRVSNRSLQFAELLQKKYFGYGALDDDVPVLSFVGRITEQKGVHLILDVAYDLIHRFNQKINILIGGPANMADPYGARCAHRMYELKAKFPHAFWAGPEEFFTDGTAVNLGSDFGLMPSAFEPGGIVQHEFFVAGTPVVAYKTGGLKDSVFEFLWFNDTGNGFNFERYDKGDFLASLERAVGTFRNKEKYRKLRENAFASTMDGSVVTKAWLGEFCRLRGKVFVDNEVVQETMAQLPALPKNFFNQKRAPLQDFFM